VWFDCNATDGDERSALEAIASGMIYSSLRNLLPAERKAGIAVLALGIDLGLAAEMAAEAASAFQYASAQR
jgi:hypothetical protein